MSTPAFSHALEIDLALLTEHDRLGPRYTSYPTADRFHSDFTLEAYQAAVQQRNQAPEPLSLYVHLPFCNTICYYCACNKIITKDKSRADVYLDYLAQEIPRQSALFSQPRHLAQLHLGGGTPTFLGDVQLSRLMELIYQDFPRLPDGEYSIEIDPRKVSADTVALLAQLGFNRMSLGVQDFDPKVQQAVNRLQSEAETLAVLEAARQSGFRSISIDLIYGLPHQNLRSFAQTLEKVIAANPDRLAVYNYAHLPHMFPPQRRILPDDLPTASDKLTILKYAIETLTAAGYVYIGMDHFAKPDDELAVAQRAGVLQRNFQGYSTHAECDLVALGMSAIGKIGSVYYQNFRDEEQYYAALNQGKLPIFRGYQLTRDDEIRRAVIQELMCHFRLEFAPFAARWGIEPDTYFSVEQAPLSHLAQSGLLSCEATGWYVTPKGRLLIRNVCMVFDWHLRHRQTQATYSKTI